MSRLVMWNLVTLDGFFDGAQPWALDWHQLVWGEELERLSIEQLHSADALLFGPGTSHATLRLLASRALSSGCVLLRYGPAALPGAGSNGRRDVSAAARAGCQAPHEPRLR